MPPLGVRFTPALALAPYTTVRATRRGQPEMPALYQKSEGPAEASPAPRVKGDRRTTGFTGARLPDGQARRHRGGNWSYGGTPIPGVCVRVARKGLTRQGVRKTGKQRTCKEAFCASVQRRRARNGCTSVMNAAENSPCHGTRSTGCCTPPPAGSLAVARGRCNFRGGGV
jgi:hypothetical protein